MDGYVLVAVVVIVILHSFNRFKIENCLRPQPLSVCIAIQLYRRARIIIYINRNIPEPENAEQESAGLLRKKIFSENYYTRAGWRHFSAHIIPFFPQRVFWVAISSLHTHSTSTHDDDDDTHMHNNIYFPWRSHCKHGRFRSKFNAIV